MTIKEIVAKWQSTRKTADDLRVLARKVGCSPYDLSECLVLCGERKIPDPRKQKRAEVRDRALSRSHAKLYAAWLDYASDADLFKIITYPGAKKAWVKVWRDKHGLPTNLIGGARREISPKRLAWDKDHPGEVK